MIPAAMNNDALNVAWFTMWKIAATWPSAVSRPMSSVIKGYARGAFAYWAYWNYPHGTTFSPLGFEEATFIAGEKNALSRDGRSVRGIADCGSRGRADGRAVGRQAGDEL